VTLLWNPDNPGSAPQVRAAEGAARALGVQLHLLEGEFQFGSLGIPATILAALEGKDLKILAPSTSGRLSDLLVARPEIKQPADLGGKRFGVISIGTGFWISAIQGLEQLGLDPQRDAISFKAVGNQLQMVQALKAGDLIDDRFVRKLDESGVIDRLYSTYGVK
jgi:ABC-type nitrate/sulfonate/bicarbonate transport system substrate-binding protein